MKVIRQTLWGHPHRADSPAVTMVARFCDLQNPEKAVEDLQRALPGGFIVTEIFELPDGVGIAEATFEGLKRLRKNEEDERNQAILYHYTVENYLPKLIETGVAFNSRPHPLDAEQIAAVFEQVAKHPVYKKQTLVGFGRDSRWVRYTSGRIVIEPMT